MKASQYYLALIVLLGVVSYGALAYDPSPLQDFCVAINDTSKTNGVFVNGKFCMDPALANANDFFYDGLKEGNTSGLNTLGISLVRVDFAPYGLNPPHTHPRATEILVVIEGTLQVGFVTSNPENRLFTKVLNKGDVFVFPIGLIHFQQNMGKTKAVAIASLSSQNPGVITIANAVFKSNPPISADILAKAFQVDKSVIKTLQN
ncbi:germin-like protein subfamily 1 member 16 [Senna tora]|uniref:Germin-like protein n=1 Tax=Senna tora TaxID=362788 RepID=A0A834TJ26_9FABA|nr:germin-like protein subfamily 1 member 16 [Senna tora]